MDNYFVIHGSYGNPYKNWIPWLKQKLAIRKKECFVSTFQFLQIKLMIIGKPF